MLAMRQFIVEKFKLKNDVFTVYSITIKAEIVYWKQILALQFVTLSTVILPNKLIICFCFQLIYMTSCS